MELKNKDIEFIINKGNQKLQPRCHKQAQIIKRIWSRN